MCFLFPVLLLLPPSNFPHLPLFILLPGHLRSLVGNSSWGLSVLLCVNLHHFLWQLAVLAQHTNTLILELVPTPSLLTLANIPV